MVKVNLKLSRVFRPLSRLAEFLKEVKTQMKKVDWPSFKEALSYTLIVILASVVLAAFLGGVDFFLTLILDRIIL